MNAIVWFLISLSCIIIPLSLLINVFKQINDYINDKKNTILQIIIERTLLIYSFNVTNSLQLTREFIRRRAGH